ncbi:MAG TPA: chemotaxis protein CheW [Candidatus Limnocylindrales bacterium]|jgi:Chemotaxis signal transduction protein|nr:chemotaxis protein CheW [Candidatus Limnocylindrales bacterium]
MAEEPTSSGSGQSGELQIVVCELADEHYGLDIARVFEIIRHQPITPVPRAPSFVKGVINLRGRIIPVVDLRARFGMPEVEPTKETRIVVAESPSTRVGLIVDGVSEVLLVPADAIEQTPAVASGADGEYLRGIAKLGGRLVLLLELDGLFGAEERTALAGAA